MCWGVGAALGSDDARLGRLQPAPASRTIRTADQSERSPAIRRCGQYNLEDCAAEILSVAIERASAPGAARTRNLRLRRPSLYPVELRARMNPEHNAV